ncbi:MAG TPA: membrane protein insertase YidC [Thermoanaerobaculia bacterium]|nr:membrane protein insertase YidC [Thermoanaerobaculia bacterium]
MEKRIFIAVVISIAFLGLWSVVIPKLFPELVKKPAPVAAKPMVAKTTGATTAATKAATPSVAPPAMHAAAPVSGTTLKQSVVDMPEFTAVFSNRGAELVSFKLKHYTTSDKQPVELVKGRDAGRTDFPFSITTKGQNPFNSALYAVNERDDHGVRVIDYRYSDGHTTVTKTFRVGPEFQFDFAVNVVPPTPYRVEIGPGIRTLAPDEIDSRFVVTGNGIAQTEGKLKVVGREKGDRVNVYDDIQFTGIEDNYFLTVLKPAKGGQAVIHRAEFKDGKEIRKELYAGVNAASDGTVSGQAFFGPKQTKILEAYGLDSTLQFGFFSFIARVLLDVLIWINKTTRNYGLAIIALTVLIKIVLYPLQHKSIVSMKKMQKVQPKVEAIKNRYKKSRTDAEQRQKMNTEMMKLYQQEGINPMGGCLPMVLQLPILWAFYGLLSRAIELRGAPFYGWIHDLSAKDPYYITPILMTITMFFQQQLTPTTGDPAQRRMFLIMPLVFGWIFKEFPSGLVLYWLVQNILTIAQQLIMNKYWKDHPAELKTA